MAYYFQPCPLSQISVISVGTSHSIWATARKKTPVCVERDLKYASMLKIESRSYFIIDHLCDLVLRVPSYSSRDPGFDSRRWEVVGL
jgi:hypothetical protein